MRLNPMFWKRARPVAAAQSNGQCSLPDAHPHHLVGKRVRLIEVQPSALFPLIDDHVIEGQGFTNDPDNPLGSLALDAMKPGLHFEFGICKVDSMTPLGSVAITVGTKEAGVLAYWMGPHGRGQGLTSEAATMATHFALGQLGLSCVFAEMATENHVSRKIAERAGLVVVKVGETKRPNGKTFETVVLARSDGPIPNTARCSVTRNFSQLTV
jgi:RimJ/RimL family protein N-acetyltransferase